MSVATVTTMPSRERASIDVPEISGEGELGVPEVSRLFEIPEGRLRYWSQTGFIRPSVRRGNRAYYTFQDLIAVKVAKGLLDAGLPLQRVRRSLTSLKIRLPEVDSPLAKLRIRCESDRVLVSATDGTFDATTGQLLLDFDVAALEREVAEVRTLPWVGQEGADLPGTATAGVAGGVGPESGYEAFVRGRELERAWDGSDVGDPNLLGAIEAYRRAVELDPDLAAAHTNLGSLLAEIGDLDGARDAFDEALRADPNQPEAQANLAELALRAGEPELAISGFRQVLRDAPDYFEAHYGLARALLSVGGKSQAVAHLERFCAAVSREVDLETAPPELRERMVQAHAVIEALRRELQGT